MRFLASTPNRTFLLFPALVLAEAGLRHGRAAVRWRWTLALLPWGYLQYRLVGQYRQRLHAGSRGMERLPDVLIQSGPYAFTRNPMYLGHLIFMLGLALSFRSVLSWVILLANLRWFHRRVCQDEARLEAAFGDRYRQYRGRVRRWIPYLL